MKGINLIKIFGFYNQKRSFMQIGAYCYNPVKHLKRCSDSHDDLICILTLLQRAIFLVRSIDLLVSKDGDWNYDLIFTGILFLFSRQLAQFLLFLNGYIIHFLMRIVFRKNDLSAAKRSYTYSTLALDPAYFLLYFGISLESAVYSVIKPFPLLMILMFVGLLLKAINISVLYKINFYVMTGATLFVSVLTFSIIPTFYLPSFLLVHFSPRITEDDVDLSVLDYHHVDIDSSFDGALLLNNLESIPEAEKSIVDSLYKKKDSITTYEIPFMDKRLKELEPFYKVTYFNKKYLPKDTSYSVLVQCEKEFSIM